VAFRAPSAGSGQALRGLCAALEARGLLRRIPTPVSPELEIAEVADRVAHRGGPALLFERVEGYDAPVLVGAFGSAERAALAFGVEKLDDLRERLPDLFGIAQGGGGIGAVLRAVGDVAQLGRVAPRRVARRGRPAPSQQVVEERPSFDALPALRAWPEDAGRSLTLPLLLGRDAARGRHVGSGRVQLYDERTAGVPLAALPASFAHALPNERVPLAIVLGADPAALLAGLVPLPADLDPLLFAGFLRRAPVEMVPARTVELEVPTAAEYVLEGYLLPGERRAYGPFGERTGHYGPVEEAAVFHLTGLTRRRDPVFPAAIPGRAARDELWLGKAAERLLVPFVRLLHPEVVDLSAPVEGGFQNVLLVAIRQSYPGQAHKVIAGLFGLMPTLLAKAIVVVDADQPLGDLAGCARRVAQNVDWRRDVLVVDGPLDRLDHAAPRRQVGAKIGIDATRKLDDERHPRGWPRELAMAPEVRELVDRKWASYGIPL